MSPVRIGAGHVGNQRAIRPGLNIQYKWKLSHIRAGIAIADQSRKIMLSNQIVQWLQARYCK
jgi:hypothetical protein